jgi:hypothetical protein
MSEESLDNRLNKLLAEGRKIEAIKLCKDGLQIEFDEAKQYIEEMIRKIESEFSSKKENTQSNSIKNEDQSLDIKPKEEQIENTVVKTFKENPKVVTSDTSKDDSKISLKAKIITGVIVLLVLRGCSYSRNGGTENGVVTRILFRIADTLIPYPKTQRDESLIVPENNEEGNVNAGNETKEPEKSSDESLVVPDKNQEEDDDDNDDEDIDNDKIESESRDSQAEVDNSSNFTRRQVKVYKGTSNFDNDIICNVYNNKVYEKRSNFDNDVICNVSGNRIYKGRSNFDNDVLYTVENGKVYKGRSNFSNDIVMTIKDGKIYKGTSNFSNDIVANINNSKIYAGRSNFGNDVQFSIEGNLTVEEFVAVWYALNFLY